MRARCSPKASKEDKPLYYDRGIRVCPEWNDYIIFHRWAIATGYRLGLMLDRRNGVQGYNPQNCRWTTSRIQAYNRRKGKGSTSRFKGVNWFKIAEKWKARIMKNGKSIFLGHFEKEEDAALAYNRAAIKLFGFDAVLNQIDPKKNARMLKDS